MIDKCYSNIFNGFKTFYPFKYIKNNNTFSLYNYLIGFFFNQRSSPQFLIHFIEENNNQIHLNEMSKEDICQNEIYILFNFIKIYFTGYNLNQYEEYLSFDKLDINSKNIEINYNELLKIFNCIKKNKPSILVSMLFLRRLLPNILEIISKKTGIETNIFSFENETLFDNGIKLLKLESDEINKNIVNEYLQSLKHIQSEFSLNGKKFSTYFKDIKLKYHQTFVDYRNYDFYDFGLKKISRTKANYNDSFGILDYGYNRSVNKIQVDYNWNFHFYEILFHCFYLTFADCLNKLTIEDKSFEYGDLEGYLNDYLNYYEYTDYYLNFINQDGAYMNISRLIMQYFPKDFFDYEQFNEKYELRKKCIDSSEYDYISKKNKLQLKIISTKSSSFLLENDNEVINNKIIIFNNKIKSNSIFLYNYNNINSSLRRFLFEGYEEKGNNYNEEYYNDLINIFPNFG